MNQFLKILQQEFKNLSEEDLYIPIAQTKLDSLDLVVLRVILEKHFKVDIPNNIWYNFTTLSESFEYLNKKNKVELGNENELTDIILTDRVEIRMPQMANCTLSENWLLKYLGDTHWQLLTKTFDKKSSDFTDDFGNRLYATFIRIQYHNSSLSYFSENDIIEFVSCIKGFGNNSFLSEITGLNEGEKVEAILMTTFAIREDEDNSKINKCETKINTNKISQFSRTPEFLDVYRLIQKNLIDDVDTKYGIFHITEEALYSCEYKINPYIDINGVGLLYFASFPIIADKCLLEYEPKSINYHTIFRDIFYFANCNATDKVIFKLNTFEIIDNQIKILVSLYRQSDNNILAKILTVKQISD